MNASYSAEGEAVLLDFDPNPVPQELIDHVLGKKEPVELQPEQDRTL